jgi:hypothetical protein
MLASMSETEIVDHRDTRTGRFLAGNNGGGRKPGSRAKLSELLLSDLRSVWETHGRQALIDCAENEPAQFVRVLANLLPRDVRIDATLDVTAFANNFRQALALLGNEPLPRPKRPMRVIDHAD